jgi:hypothetical protein
MMHVSVFASEFVLEGLQFLHSANASVTIVRFALHTRNSTKLHAYVRDALKISAHPSMNGTLLCVSVKDVRIIVGMEK